MIFVIVLQQFDGNILGPRIISGSVGISSFWAMFSIIFFSGLFGFMGMIIGVPLCALLLSLIAALCKHSLEHKALPVDSADYAGVQAIDAETGERIMLPPKPKIRDKPSGVIAGLLKSFIKSEAVHIPAGNVALLHKKAVRAGFPARTAFCAVL